MQPLQEWSFARVLLVSGAWIVLCLLVAVAWILFQLRGVFAASSGSGGVGAVSGGVSELILAIPIVPPIILILAWLITRRSQGAQF
jgi:hypothetical protein